MAVEVDENIEAAMNQALATQRSEKNSPTPSSIVVKPYVAPKRKSRQIDSAAQETRDRPALRIEYKLRLSSGICSFLAKEFVQHVLYLRQQIPNTIQDLRLWCVEQERLRQLPDPKTGKKRARRLLSGPQKQVPKLVHQMDLLLETLESVFTDSSVVRLVLLFGNSHLAAKEIYVLHFDNFLVCDREENLKLHNACARKMARTWLQHQSTSVPQHALRKTRLHVFVEAPAEREFANMRPKPALRTAQLFGDNKRKPPFRSEVEFCSRDSNQTKCTSTDHLVWYHFTEILSGLKFRIS